MSLNDVNWLIGGEIVNGEMIGWIFSKVIIRKISVGEGWDKSLRVKY